MSKRKPLDKMQARERRNRLLETAAAAELSLTEGVREMRTIAGMTQEEFARHRGVSPRVIKALELGQGNPTVATLNRIGEFFGLEVAFVPIRRTVAATSTPQPSTVATEALVPLSSLGPKVYFSYDSTADVDSELSAVVKEGFEKGFTEALKNELAKAFATLDIQRKIVEQLESALNTTGKPIGTPAPAQAPGTPNTSVRKKKSAAP